MMGFYSVFASVSGMFLVSMISHMSYAALVRQEPLSTDAVTKWIVLAYSVALIECILPIAGVGSFAYSGEGFCYIDWSNTAQAVCMEIITIPLIVSTSYWFGSCAVHSAVGAEEAVAPDAHPLTKASPSSSWWWIFALAYFSGWVLWLPAIFIAADDDSEPYPEMFPHGYMINGGALGHAQALLNPYLYGVRWRSWFQAEAPPASQLVEEEDSEAKNKLTALQL